MIGSSLIRFTFSERFLNKLKITLGLRGDSYYELENISRLGRYNSGSTNLIHPGFKFVDSESFINQYLEIFENDILYFKTDVEKPVILDCGSNIGLSITYFKRLYPKSKIVGFEPDPKIFDTLKFNLKNFDREELELHNKAVWHEETTLSFIPDNADGGALHKTGKLKVESVDLNDYLQQPVELLKIDIEGAEHDVLPSICGNLRNVKFLFLEVHLNKNRPTQIENIFKLLRENHFTYSFNSVRNMNFKLLSSPTDEEGFIQQLNIFAINENS